MRETLRLARFTLERHHRVWMSTEVRVQNLDGHVRAGISRALLRAIQCAEHESHSSAPDQLLEREAVLDHLTGCELGALRRRLRAGSVRPFIGFQLPLRLDAARWG